METEEIRIFVGICRWGINIAGFIDTDALVEYAKTTDNPRVSAVVEEFARTSPVLELLPFKEVVGSAFTYSKEERLPGIAFRFSWAFSCVPFWSLKNISRTSSSSQSVTTTTSKGYMSKCFRNSSGKSSYFFADIS